MRCYDNEKSIVQWGNVEITKQRYHNGESTMVKTRNYIEFSPSWFRYFDFSPSCYRHPNLQCTAIACFNDILKYWRKL